ncbi:hypothetical protein FIBSPDRAFT_856260, partial [Athelia psychrophila]
RRIGGGLTKFNSFPFRLVCLRRPSPFRRVASGTPGVCYVFHALKRSSVVTAVAERVAIVA